MGTISRVSIHAFVSSIDRRRRARRRAVLCLVYGDQRSSARADIGHGQSEPDRSAALSARAGKACGRCRRETACRGRQARHRRAEAGAPEEKPAIAQDKPAAVEEKSAATDDKPAIVEQKPAPAEAKPAVAQDKPAAVEEKSAATDDKPAIVEQKPAVPDAKPAVVEQKPAPDRGKTSGCARETSLNRSPP